MVCSPKELLGEEKGTEERLPLMAVRVFSTLFHFLQVSRWQQLFGSQVPIQGQRGLAMKWSWGSHEFLPRLGEPGMSLSH